VSFTPSARRWVSRESCTSARTKVRTTHPRPGQRHLLTAPAPSRAIRGVLGKFADLPHEVEEEIRGLDEARRRIAELERQIKQLKGASGVQRIDQTTVERAVKSAVERERALWQRKSDQAKVRFRQATTGLASMGQSLDKVKGLLQEVEREWPAGPASGAAPRTFVNHGPEHTAKPANDRVLSDDRLDGPLKLSAGERRILTALAQYPQGRRCRWRF
jgi:hypothetical protein